MQDDGMGSIQAIKFMDKNGNQVSCYNPNVEDSFENNAGGEVQDNQ